MAYYAGGRNITETNRLPVNVQDEELSYLSGAGTNSTVTLTSANTAYDVPTTPPTDNYVLVIYNNSDTDQYWGFQDSNANGVLIPPEGRVTFNMGASESVYAYCASAGKTIVATVKKVV